MSYIRDFTVGRCHDTHSWHNIPLLVHTASILRGLPQGLIQVDMMPQQYSSMRNYPQWMDGSSSFTWVWRMSMCCRIFCPSADVSLCWHPRAVEALHADANFTHTGAAMLVLNLFEFRCNMMKFPYNSSTNFLRTESQSELPCVDVSEMSVYDYFDEFYYEKLCSTKHLHHGGGLVCCALGCYIGSGSSRWLFLPDEYNDSKANTGLSAKWPLQCNCVNKNGPGKKPHCIENRIKFKFFCRIFKQFQFAEMEISAHSIVKKQLTCSNEGSTS